MSGFSTHDIASQAGRLAVVTGANSGLGYETALALADAGAEVILAARSETKGREAIARIQARSPAATVRLELLDLSRLDSVAAFSQRLIAAGQPLDMLINNAGVMALPQRQLTADGFEMQLGVNHLGHYALTAHLLPLLRRAASPRVVNLSSLMHRIGAIHFDDLQLERGYTPYKAYGQSKLAVLMFALELQRRSDAQGWGLVSNAAHPGASSTSLIANGSGSESIVTRLGVALVHVIGQPAAAGALPTLYAATSPAAKGAAYYGPDGFAEIKGAVGSAHVSARASDTVAAARLWDASQALTGVSFV